MSEHHLVSEFLSLPPHEQQLVVDYIAFLKQKNGSVSSGEDSSGGGKITDDPFIGMWSDRQDMADSNEWVRMTRRREW
jgi:hypothetical protein